MEVKIESSWRNVMRKEFEKEYFKDLTQFIKDEYSSETRIFPEADQIFRAFDECPFQDVKVVILGQDPYPTFGHAHGLCFSCDEEVRPLPKSLKNIYKEMKSDLGTEERSSGNLVDWAKQGVLMLNTVLTVQEGQPGSHAGKGWEQFTDTVINQLSDNKSGVVFMLWGSKAMRKAQNVTRSTNLILSAPHPSPLSAYRGFFGCKHFSQANAYLRSLGKSEIIW